MLTPFADIQLITERAKQILKTSVFVAIWLSGSHQAESLVSDLLRLRQK